MIYYVMFHYTTLHYAITNVTILPQWETRRLLRLLEPLVGGRRFHRLGGLVAVTLGVHDGVEVHVVQGHLRKAGIAYSQM